MPDLMIPHVVKKIIIDSVHLSLNTSPNNKESLLSSHPCWSTDFSTELLKKNKYQSSDQNMDNFKSKEESKRMKRAASADPRSNSETLKIPSLMQEYKLQIREPDLWNDVFRSNQIIYRKENNNEL
jgi:hypothetical protein